MHAIDSLYYQEHNMSATLLRSAHVLLAIKIIAMIIVTKSIYLVFLRTVFTNVTKGKFYESEAAQNTVNIIILHNILGVVIL